MNFHTFSLIQWRTYFVMLVICSLNRLVTLTKGGIQESGYVYKYKSFGTKLFYASGCYLCGLLSVTAGLFFPPSCIKLCFVLFCLHLFIFVLNYSIQTNFASLALTGKLVRTWLSSHTFIQVQYFFYNRVELSWGTNTFESHKVTQVLVNEQTK